MSSSQFISMISSVGGNRQLSSCFTSLIESERNTLMYIWFVWDTYYSRSTFNVMACNTLHKPTPQRELAMVSKFTPVASHLTLSYICSRFYDLVTLYFVERQESNEIAVWTIRYSADQFDNNLIEFKAWFCNVYTALQKLNYSHSRLLVISLRSLCTWYSL